MYNQETPAAYGSRQGLLSLYVFIKLDKLALSLQEC
ncbi:hypothetical protein RAAC3_TM7C00001G0818 [Candidatus Saccharibacteria bacterium RAAC3_TM7_1]|nr:hypothetical protein RAAC3_TM7C00001G0818 [Candidatus Saccharibacteria bacterium RAAC3_TM7_1]